MTVDSIYNVTAFIMSMVLAWFGGYGITDVCLRNGVRVTILIAFWLAWGFVCSYPLWS